MKVRQLMTTDVSFCLPTTTLNDAAHLMWEHDCGSLPVMSAGGGRRVLGMITDRDICMAAYHQGKGLKELAVQDAMSNGARSCSPDDDVVQAERIMREARVRRMPVVDANGQLVGFLSLAQIARAAGDGKSGVSGKEVGETLAAICQPSNGPRVRA